MGGLYLKIKNLGYEILINRFMRYCMPDSVYLKYVFKRQLGYKLNLNNPQTFSEKIQWIKLNDHNPLYTFCADKVLVRKYVKDKIGSEYLIPIVGIYDKVDDIEWSCMPNSFVLKLNTGSGYNYICHDKEYLDIDDVKNKFNKWTKEKFYKRHKEYHYKNIEKKILCECLLEDENLFDYKVFCFDGSPYIIMVELGENFQNHRNIYYTDWTRHEGWITFPQDNIDIPQPVCLDELLNCARLLSKGFREVRVDFYIVKNKIYFGEMTFTSGAGFSVFSSYEFDLEMGQKVNLLS